MIATVAVGDCCFGVMNYVFVLLDFRFHPYIQRIKLDLFIMVLYNNFVYFLDSYLQLYYYIVAS